MPKPLGEFSDAWPREGATYIDAIFDDKKLQHHLFDLRKGFEKWESISQKCNKITKAAGSNAEALEGPNGQKLKEYIRKATALLNQLKGSVKGLKECIGEYNQQADNADGVLDLGLESLDMWKV